MNTYTNDSLFFLQGFATEKHFSHNECLFAQGDAPNGCFVIISGEVETYCFDTDIQAEATLQRYYDGEVVGTVGTIDGGSRQVSARACSDVHTYFVSNDDIARMKSTDLSAYEKYIHLSGNTLAKKFRELHEQAKASAVSQSTSPIVNDIVERANVSQQSFLHWNDHNLSRLLFDIAHAVNEQAVSLARQCVEESGMGVVEHKVQKIKMGTVDVVQSLDLYPKSQIELEAPGVESIAMPMGVVFAMIPVTNPVETIVFKVLSSLKARNAVIISSHRKTRGVGDRTVAIIREVLLRHGAPADLVQVPSLPANRKLTQAFMSHDGVHFILATGGPSMVKSAYRSGTPAIGVGKGNAPVWICEDANLESVASTVVSSKSFDNGVVCGSENNLIVDDNVADELLDLLAEAGAAVLSNSETTQLLQTVFAEGTLGAEFVGQSAEKICAHVGIERDYHIRLIVAEASAQTALSPLLREKLAPILSFVRVDDEEQALFIARSILNIEGRGHTAMVHSQNQERIHAFANAVEVSRVLVNSPGTQGCIGACNGLELSWTLGCGTHGGGSTSDNVTYRHLQNQKRIAYAHQSAVATNTSFKDKVKNSFVARRKAIRNLHAASM